MRFLVLSISLLFACISCDTGKASSSAVAPDDTLEDTSSEDGVKGKDTATGNGAPTDSTETGSTDTATGSTINSLDEKLDEASLLRITELLASDEMGGRNEGSPGSEAARELILERLRSCGIDPAGDSGYEQRVVGSKCVNLIGQVPGNDPDLEDEHILLSAHYDHLGECGGKICNGAYDNAAAVAAVIEIACVAAEQPGDRGLLVALWDCEEPPTFLTDNMGSEYFAAHPTIPLEDIPASIVLDLFGSELWPNFNGLIVLGTETSDVLRNHVDELPPIPGLQAFNMGLHAIEEQPFGHHPFSDYDAFRNREVPVVFISDGKNKDYHEPTDDWDHIVPEKLVLETRWVLHLTHSILGGEETPTWQGHPHLGLDGLEAAIEVGNIALGKTDIPGIVPSLGLNSQSKSKLTSDIKALEKIRARILSSGDELTKTDIKAVRKAAQRLMCLAGSSPAEFFCGLL